MYHIRRGCAVFFLIRTLMWWHYQETLSSENWWQVPWMTRPASPSLNQCVCSSFHQSPHTHWISQHLHKFTLQTHKNNWFALCATDEETLRDAGKHGNTHSSIYTSSPELFHTAVTLITKHTHLYMSLSLSYIDFKALKEGCQKWPIYVCPGSPVPDGWFGNLLGNKNPLLLLLFFASLHCLASEFKTETAHHVPILQHKTQTSTHSRCLVHLMYTSDIQYYLQHRPAKSLFLFTCYVMCSL